MRPPFVRASWRHNHDSSAEISDQIVSVAAGAWRDVVGKQPCGSMFVITSRPRRRPATRGVQNGLRRSAVVRPWRVLQWDPGQLGVRPRTRANTGPQSRLDMGQVDGDGVRRTNSGEHAKLTWCGALA